MVTERTEVILVDDLRMWRESLTSNLNSFNIDVKESVENGAELIELLKTKVNVPNIILLDLEMPVMDGSATLDVLMKDFPNKRVIVTTQYDNEQLIMDFFNRGASAYVPKNSELITLVEAINTLKTESLYKKNLTDLFESARLSNRRYYFKMLYTLREREIINLLCDGLSVSEIAKRLYIGEKTVETHLTEIYKKANVGNRYEFMKVATKNGFNYMGSKNINK